MFHYFYQREVRVKKERVILSKLNGHQGKLVQYCILLNLLNLFPVPVRLHSGSGKLIFRRYFTTIFDIKNVVQSLEPGETPGYSASHQAPNYEERS